MAAEEAKDPSRSIPIAYVGGIVTLVALAMGVMILAGGVGDWTHLANINDPLPQAMKIVVGTSSGWLHMLVWLGLFGLIASFHGIILGYRAPGYPWGPAFALLGAVGALGAMVYFNTGLASAYAALLVVFYALTRLRKQSVR